MMSINQGQNHIQQISERESAASTKWIHITKAFDDGETGRENSW